jgi:RimJ/RimL family protein N-acetyltransferase
MFPATFPLLNTRRLLLRALSEEDIGAIFAIFSDQETMRYWSGPPMTTAAEAHALLAWTQHDYDAQKALRWCMIRRDDHQFLGTCRLFDYSAQNQRAELGYVLQRDYWGQGYIQEALAAVVDYAFTVLALHRLEVDIDPRNSASIRTAARLGFVQEGHLRERWIVDGEVSDSLIMGLLRSEWQVRHDA